MRCHVGWAVLATMVLAAGSLAVAGAEREAETPQEATASSAAPAAASPPEVQAQPSPGEIQAQPPPFSDGIFPCSDCHTEPGDPTRRTLEVHDDIQGIFDHDAENRWCLDCHDQQNRDALRLASGAHVPFSESYRLCGQCHGDKYRDWRAGIHGKRIGSWNGQKTYYLCVNCHNPHSPRFKPLEPMPRPDRPEEMKR